MYAYWTEKRQALLAWLRIASHPQLVRRSFKVSLVVGSILTLINHGDKFLADGPMLSDGVRVVLTYMVPFSVSTWASVQSMKVPAERKRA